jgi:hypothetical protein
MPLCTVTKACQREIPDVLDMTPDSYHKEYHSETLKCGSHPIIKRDQDGSFECPLCLERISRYQVMYRHLNRHPQEKKRKRTNSETVNEQMSETLAEGKLEAYLLLALNLNDG